MTKFHLEMVDETINPPIHQSINPSIHQSINPSIQPDPEQAGQL
ncbi:hypothetical protein [uncultured Roseobacter sp.]|nr:hypothetical protein [uncultured Roseobacter sp.]